MSKINYYKHQGQFKLESGQAIDELTIAYQTFGTYKPNGNNVVWVCHALTGNSNVFDWWQGVFGENSLFNPNEHFIVCANVIGSCYGTTGPLSPVNGRPLLDKFPLITTRDMAKAHDELRKALEIKTIHLLIGASLGGQQALEWSIAQPNVIKHLIVIASNARHSAFGIAFNESQRLAINADATYGNGNSDGGKKGLKAARSIAMLGYRSYDGYKNTQTETDNAITDNFKASTYQQYQGEKLSKRFNAYTYVILSKAMDAHNVGRNQASIEEALKKISAKTLVIGITSDILFPIIEQQFISKCISKAQLKTIDSDFGHDGFLVENEQLCQHIFEFMHPLKKTTL